MDPVLYALDHGRQIEPQPLDPAPVLEFPSPETGPPAAPLAEAA